MGLDWDVNPEFQQVKFKNSSVGSDPKAVRLRQNCWSLFRVRVQVRISTFLKVLDFRKKNKDVTQENDLVAARVY